ncbi:MULTISPECIES: hypothetical protein [unclassified Paenibacillus]|uniref:hypothetical protein n=1 Tax=unclassified Paenibacillus TaxID=185978 RepID=UPI001AE93291|nr:MULTISPECIES: hypothetical protein [unclassified Paenibacillus]MBP1155736.1 uroporphyrinogen-III decarboxylase [Paenibacillus sp. PvP091]MBP1168878.1 uroporphyrinogen-III decarboxylase [Paenibacillus sp. PvR098]MBP2439906.1 uroporphyrinogen-III decarboxylase [Paenibacillus sp. PvP052]
MSSPKELLNTVLTGGRAGRKLLAPLVCAAAGEMASLSPKEFLNNSTKMANTLRDLQRALGLDVVVPESGSNIEWEALGAKLDWSVYPPRPNSYPFEGDIALAFRGRMPVLVETVKRLKQMLGDKAAVAVALQGPQRISDAGDVGLDDAADFVLRMARVACESGADLIWLKEDGEHPPLDTDEYLALTAPIWGTIRFYQSVPALHLAGSADRWLDTVLDAGGSVIPCIDPLRSPELSAALKSAGTYGAIVGDDMLTLDKAASLRAFAQEPGCLLLTSESDWFGRVTARDFQTSIDQWKMLINP